MEEGSADLDEFVFGHGAARNRPLPTAQALVGLPTAHPPTPYAEIARALRKATLRSKPDKHDGTYWGD